ncbi:PTS IIA-like nitrogen regulatory protein PtsN [Parahaliea sp. F7430]|uniref:PTS IIA-like nitrogen regulatory protein PtsN n=1 Tax=Sediminihaliea albiluteola TaxID=2758564 RepID=A0A7W2TW32_9GAMM|nr:PTS IIA-like nitrogen regulatory protein PtsN [Sediminihaliea albiluteola]MBA6412997.1 PTS IIA-like nitrogen regulatory protein PtsN [Sediminihaliea albiluteola]
MHTLAQILTPGRTLCRVSGGSKKRLFETIAKLIGDDQLSLPANEVFTQLIAREKLGSTGLGKGIAIPHCRINNCTQPLGCLLTLDEPIDFDAPDGDPVDLLFVLLVPDEAHQQHLDILSHIASLFSQEAFCSALRQAEDTTSLFQIATNWAA